MGKIWIIRMVLFAVAAVLLFSAVVKWLWNWLVPELFQGPAISLWEAAGLLLLSKILWGGHWGGGHGMRRRSWRKKFEEKWARMSAEEREKVRNHCSMPCYHRQSSAQPPQQIHA